MPDAICRQASGQMDDFTPSADVATGDVVVTGDTPRVCHKAIKAGELGAVAAMGGVYRMVAAAAIAVNKTVYWDATAKKVTETASGNKKFGWTVTAAVAPALTCDVRHSP